MALEGRFTETAGWTAEVAAEGEALCDTASRLESLFQQTIRATRSFNVHLPRVCNVCPVEVEEAASGIYNDEAMLCGSTQPVPLEERLIGQELIGSSLKVSGDWGAVEDDRIARSGWPFGSKDGDGGANEPKSQVCVFLLSPAIEEAQSTLNSDDSRRGCRRHTLYCGCGIAAKAVS